MELRQCLACAKPDSLVHYECIAAGGNKALTQTSVALKLSVFFFAQFSFFVPQKKMARSHYLVVHLGFEIFFFSSFVYKNRIHLHNSYV